MAITKSDIQELFKSQKFNEIYKLLYCSQDESLITEFIRMCFDEGDFFVPLATIYRVIKLRHFPGLLRDEKNQALRKVEAYVKEHRVSDVCEDLVELLKLGNKRGPDKTVLDDFLMTLIRWTSFAFGKNISHGLLSFRDIPSWTRLEANVFIDRNFPAGGSGSSGIVHMEEIVVEMCTCADPERVERVCNVCLRIGESDRNRFPKKEFMEIIKYASPDFRTNLVVEWTKEVGRDWVMGDAPVPRFHEIEQLVNIGIDRLAALSFLNELINFDGLWPNVAALLKILLHKNIIEGDEIESAMKLVVSKCPHYSDVRHIQEMLMINELSGDDVALLKEAYLSKGNINSLTELSSQYDLNLNKTDKNLCKEKIFGKRPMSSDITKFIDIFDLTLDEIADILQDLIADKRLNTAIEIMTFCQSHCTQDQIKQLKDAF